MKLIINEELENILKKLAKDNTLAKEILECEQDEEGKYINYLGKSEEAEGYLSYLTRAKIQSGYITDFWNPKSRLHAKPASVIELLFPSVHSQRNKEIFTERYRNIIQQSAVKDQVELVEGEDIRKWYYEGNYVHRSKTTDGSLGGSCMRYRSCSRYMDIYCKNVNNVSMACIFDDEKKLKSRCIIWFPNGKEDQSVIYYDRIYGANIDDEKEMQAILDKRGYINISTKNVIKPTGEIHIKFYLEYGFAELNFYPYMDTMAYINGKCISNERMEYSIELRDTDGGHEETNRCNCDRCGESYDEEDLYTIVAGGYEGEELCEDCCVYSTHYNGYISENEAVHINEDWVLESDICTDYAGRKIFEPDSILLYNGLRADEDDAKLQKSEDEDYFIEGDDNFVEVDFNWYKKDSSEIENIEGTYYVIGSDDYEEAILLMEQEL